MNIKHDIYLISDSTGETLDRIFMSSASIHFCKHHCVGIDGKVPMGEYDNKIEHRLFKRNSKWL